MKISIIVPVFNESDNILSLIKEIDLAMAEAEVYEIIYVDDGSTDDTSRFLQQAQQQFSALRVIKHQQSYGQSTAIHTGIKHAVYPIVATLDGDGQNDPADIPRLYNILITEQNNINNLCMIAGWRQKRNDSTWRVIASKIANTVRSALLKDNTPDTGCGLKVFLRNKFLDLPYFDHMHRFLPALIIRTDGFVISAPVNHRNRKHGVSKYGTWDRLWVGIIDMMGVMWLNSRAKRVLMEEIKND